MSYKKIPQVSKSREFIVLFNDGRTRTEFAPSKEVVMNRLKQRNRTFKEVFDATDFMHVAKHW